MPLSGLPRPGAERLPAPLSEQAGGPDPGHVEAQNQLGWLSTETMEEIEELLDVDPTDVNAVASFYTMFHLRPVKQLIEVCQSPACWVNGAVETMHRLCDRLGIQSQEGATGGHVGGRGVHRALRGCLATCDKAPAVQVNLRYHGGAPGGRGALPAGHAPLQPGAAGAPVPGQSRPGGDGRPYR